MQTHFAGKCFLHKNLSIKNKQLKHEQNLLIFIVKKGVVLILADYFKQNFNKIVIKLLSMGEIRYMIILNGHCNDLYECLLL